MGFYIIEINDKYKQVVLLSAEGELYCKDVAGLLPYTAPDLEQVRKEAYDKGYDDAAEEIGSDEQAIADKAYKKGLSDAWEAARKISQYSWSMDMVYDAFPKFKGQHYSLILGHYSASEAIEKIRQYEQEKEEIQVGDEVENTQTGVKFIVTHLWKNNRGEQGVSGFNRECSAFSTTLSLVVKTGRHFPEIAKVLEKMREEE